MPLTIVVLDPISEQRLGSLRALLPEGFEIEAAASREEADQLTAIARADFAITGDVPVTGAMMRVGAAARLKAVHKWGVGIDNIDVDAARGLGLRVLRTTGSNARAVAETAVALILTLQRSVVPGHEGMLRGEWLKGALGPRTFLLTGKTVGLVGLGFIGQNVARLLSGFDCRVVYAKPTPLALEEEADLGIERVTLDALIRESEVISLHCALTPETRGLIGAREFAAMREGVLVVNTARGGIVVEDDLADAVESGHVRGAALDVFEVEPLPPQSRLIGLAGVILTPHIAAQAADNFARTVSRMFDNIGLVSRGEEPPPLDTVV